MPLFPPLARAAGVLEIIDGPLPVAFDDMACCMTDIARVNGLFGGRMVTMIHVKRLLAALPADRLITVLDVGTGAGDIPRALVRWARGEGRRIAPLPPWGRTLDEGWRIPGRQWPCRFQWPPRRRTGRDRS